MCRKQKIIFHLFQRLKTVLSCLKFKYLQLQVIYEPIFKLSQQAKVIYLFILLSLFQATEELQVHCNILDAARREFRKIWGRQGGLRPAVGVNWCKLITKKAMAPNMSYLSMVCGRPVSESMPLCRPSLSEPGIPNGYSGDMFCRQIDTKLLGLQKYRNIVIRQ